MTAAEVLTGGGIILVAMTLIQIAPIKLDPWSAVARAIGRAINKDVIEKLDETIQTMDYKFNTGNAVTDVIINDKYQKGQRPEAARQNKAKE